MVQTYNHIGVEAPYKDMQAPCVLFDGSKYHLYGVGCDHSYQEVMHLSAYTIGGPWREEECTINETGTPAVLFYKGFHMYIDSDEGIVYAFSADGKIFAEEPLEIQGKCPHISRVVNDRGENEFYLTYSVESVLMLAKANNPKGPWKVVGKIIEYKAKNAARITGAHIIQHTKREYDSIKKKFVCILSAGSLRQQLYIAVSDDIGGPYKIKPLLENNYVEYCHPTMLVDPEYSDVIHLFYQTKSTEEDAHWKYGRAIIDTRKKIFH
jgi:hypothetical protein